MQIFINRFHKDNVLEKYLEAEFEVYSRSGLNETEKRLIKVLSSLKEPDSILILENRTGVVAMIASSLFPRAKITVQNNDKYFCDKVNHNLGHNKCTGIDVVCSSEIRGNYDVVLYSQSKANLIKEFVFDLVQQSHACLKPRAKLFLAMESSEKLVTRKMQEIFGGATIHNPTEKGLLLIGKKKNKAVPYDDYSDEFDYTALDGTIIKLKSYPGVFAHHRVDEGAKVLIESVEVWPDDVLIDMGCGIGSIGIALAKMHDLAKIILVDSAASAVKAALENCRKNELPDYEVILSASGCKASPKGSLFVGNPPYFSDYRIAGIFVDAAWDNLKKGGRAWFVAKNAERLRELLQNRFGNCLEKRLHGYKVLFCTKNM